MDEIEIRPWVRRGSMLVNTSALEIDDEDHIYNQILALGKRPEDYGYEHPYAAEFGEKSHGELVQEILKLRKELLSCYRYL